MLFQVPELTDKDDEVIERVDQLRANLRYAIGQPLLRWTGVLRRISFARAIRGSNSIEGYNVTVEDAMAAAEGQEPQDAEAGAWAAVVGYQRALTYILQLANDPHFTYGSGFLRSMHYMMLEHDLTKIPGRWRSGPVYVRNDDAGEIVYEAPDAELVPELMAELISALNARDGTMSALVRAAMGHLNLVMIHPFMDGNGRMARALQTLILAREGILEPTFCSIEEYLGQNTQEYYKVLQQVGAGSWHPERDAGPWIRFILTAHFRQAATLLARTREIQRLWDSLEIEIKRRMLPERTILALGDAAIGLRVRNSMYRTVAEIAENVASHDLKVLVDAGLLIPKGERRGRHYVASSVLHAIRRGVRETSSFEDPFASEYLPGLAPRS